MVFVFSVLTHTQCCFPQQCHLLAITCFQELGLLKGKKNELSAFKAILELAGFGLWCTEQGCLEEVPCLRPPVQLGRDCGGKRFVF